MITQKTRDTFWTLFAITALGVYVLACRPSVSPDGTRVVFPVIDSEAKEASVALYDLRKDTVETIYALPGSDGENLALSVQWLPNNRSVVVNTVSSIAILPLGSPNAPRLLPLPEKLEPGSLVIPPPVIGNYQFLAGKSFLMRVNLETGEIVSGDISGECYLTGDGDRVYYMALTKGDDEGGYEVGELDTTKLTRIPFLQLEKQDYGELTPFLAMTRDGSRLALTGQFEDVPRITLFRGNTPEKILPVATKEDGIEIGNAAWSPDERTLYVAFSRKPGEEGNRQYGILEVPVKGGRIVETVLFTGAHEDNWASSFQIALSPNGRYVVASSICLEDGTAKPEDRSLFMVDLGSPDRRVARVAVPFPAAPRSARELK
jgi:hypothetical protein